MTDYTEERLAETAADHLGDDEAPPKQVERDYEREALAHAVRDEVAAVVAAAQAFAAAFDTYNWTVTSSIRCSARSAPSPGVRIGCWKGRTMAGSRSA